MIKKTVINPWDWSLKFGFNQAEFLENAQRCLMCSGQTSVDENGTPQHINDMRNQMILSLQNLQHVLEAADMTFGNVSKLTIYTTDLDETIEHYDVIGMTFGSVDSRPPTTLLGITRLAMPEFMFEIEATAAD